MAVATPERKYMTMLAPRANNIGALQASQTGVVVADLTDIARGNPYVFFQADGADLYIMSGPTAAIASQINPGATGQPGPIGTTGGSIPSGPANTPGICWRLISASPPVRFILEPGIDLYFGFMLVNPSQNAVLRWMRASMVSGPQ